MTKIDFSFPLSSYQRNSKQKFRQIRHDRSSNNEIEMKNKFFKLKKKKKVSIILLQNLKTICSRLIVL